METKLHLMYKDIIKSDMKSVTESFNIVRNAIHNDLDKEEHEAIDNEIKADLSGKVEQMRAEMMELYKKVNYNTGVLEAADRLLIAVTNNHKEEEVARRKTILVERSQTARVDIYAAKSLAKEILMQTELAIDRGLTYVGQELLDEMSKLHDNLDLLGQHVKAQQVYVQRDRSQEIENPGNRGFSQDNNF